MLERRGFLIQMGSSLIVVSSGCGTVLHHERIGQPRSREIDWEVAALNGLGLALFFVPGVIAFAVDFYNGTIYLPEGAKYTASRRDPDAIASTSATKKAVDTTRDLVVGAAEGSVATLRQVFLGESEAQSRESIELALAQETDKDISLADDDIRISSLNGLDQFDDQYEKHRMDPEYGVSPTTFFSDGADTTASAAAESPQ
ncbi:MAG: hypothetical protein AAGI63_18205 [Planctomycetota bacterium]